PADAIALHRCASRAHGASGLVATCASRSQQLQQWAGHHSGTLRRNWHAEAMTADRGCHLCKPAARCELPTDARVVMLAEKEPNAVLVIRSNTVRVRGRSPIDDSRFDQRQDEGMRTTREACRRASGTL